MSYVLVDPDSAVSFSNDWGDFLSGSSPPDAISSRSWSISPMHGDSPETPTLANSTSAKVTAKNMRAGNVYSLTEHIITAAGMIEDRTITLRCDSK